MSDHKDDCGTHEGFMCTCKESVPEAYEALLRAVRANWDLVPEMVREAARAVNREQS